MHVYMFIIVIVAICMLDLSISDPWRQSTHNPPKPLSGGLNLLEGYHYYH